jgi:hypothetical protein
MPDPDSVISQPPPPILPPPPGQPPPSAPTPAVVKVPVPAGDEDLLDPAVIARREKRGEAENEAEYAEKD